MPRKSIYKPGDRVILVRSKEGMNWERFIGLPWLVGQWCPILGLYIKPIFRAKAWKERFPDTRRYSSDWYSKRQSLYVWDACLEPLIKVRPKKGDASYRYITKFYSTVVHVPRKVADMNSKAVVRHVTGANMQFKDRGSILQGKDFCLLNIGTYDGKIQAR